MYRFAKAKSSRVVVIGIVCAAVFLAVVAMFALWSQDKALPSDFMANQSQTVIASSTSAPKPAATTTAPTPSKSGRGFYDSIKAEAVCQTEYDQGQVKFDIRLCWPVEGDTDPQDRYDGFMYAACQGMSLYIQSGSTWSIEWKPDGTAKVSKDDFGAYAADVRDYYQLKQKAGRFPATAPDFPTALKQYGCIFGK